MAKPRGKHVQAKKPASSKPTNAKPTALTIRGGPDCREWVERGADHCRTDVAKLVDAALIDYLRARGFEESPPRR